jgi:hypothetical protein
MSRTVLISAFWVAVSLTLGVSSAHAQSLGAGSSLGGYGGSMSGRFDSAIEMGTPVIPYAGKFAGFMPYRMGGGGTGSLSFRSRESAQLGSMRTSFSLSSMSGGMKMESGAALRPISSFGRPGGTGLGGGMQPSMSGTLDMGVMPPSFAYPFRQPPSLVAPSASGMGTSM